MCCHVATNASPAILLPPELWRTAHSGLHCLQYEHLSYKHLSYSLLPEYHHAWPLIEMQGIPSIGAALQPGPRSCMNNVKKQAWATCRSELRGASAKAQQRIAAEEAWLQLAGAHSLPVHIFRLGGQHPCIVLTRYMWALCNTLLI
jgi:hypothetical protein